MRLAYGAPHDSSQSGATTGSPRACAQRALSVPDAGVTTCVIASLVAWWHCAPSCVLVVVASVAGLGVQEE